MGNASMKTTNPKKYGWIRDHSDKRDKYKLFTEYSNFSQIDLREKCPDIYTQGKIGSCTANALAAAYEFDLMKQKKDVFIPSRLFIYYNERVLENTVESDSGAQIKDGIKTLSKQGVVPEEYWTYDISKFRIKPPNDVYTRALNYKNIIYSRVQQNLDDIREVLHRGTPISFGFTVYESFEHESITETGMMTMPRDNEKMLGGHAVLAVGYNDSLKVIILRNSWGDKWADKGYFYMPYDYIVNKDLASDFWVIERLESVKLYPTLED